MTCRNCHYYRCSSFINTERTEEQSMKNIYCNSIEDYKNSGVKHSETGTRRKHKLHICLKTLDILDDISVTCQSFEEADELDRFSFRKYFEIINSGRQPNGYQVAIKTGIINYFEICYYNEYCGCCKHWIEKYSDDAEKLSVFLPDIPTIGGAFLCKNVEGYCLCDYSEKLSSDEGCIKYRYIYEYADAKNRADYVPMVSSAQRNINVVRMARSLLWLELFYCKNLIDEINHAVNTSSDSSKAKEITEIIHARYEKLTPTFILRITSQARPVVKRHLLDIENLPRNYDCYLMCDIAEYFNIPLYIMYGLDSSGYCLDHNGNDEMIVKLIVSPTGSGTDTKIERQCVIWADEDFLFMVSVLLKIYNNDEFEDFVNRCENAAVKPRNKKHTEETNTSSPKSLLERVIYANRYNNIRPLSLATGITEKRLRNYYNAKNGEEGANNIDGGGKLTFNDLIRIADALDVSVKGLISGEKEANVINPFEHFSDDQFEYRQITEEKLLRPYLQQNLRYMYSLYSEHHNSDKCVSMNNELMSRLINVYKIWGIDSINKWIIMEELPRLKGSHPKEYQAILNGKAI